MPWRRVMEQMRSRGARSRHAPARRARRRSARSDEFAGVFSQETIERYIAESADLLGDGQDQRLRARARASFRARAPEGARPGGGHDREGHARGAVRLRPQRGRSQMAAGLVKLARRAVSTSAPPAATRPSEINPAVVEAMNEVGVDMARSSRSRSPTRSSAPPTS